MPGLVPGIHAFLLLGQDVDGRGKPGHDGEGRYCVFAFAIFSMRRASGAQ
jgi:hypothetical protein